MATFVQLTDDEFAGDFAALCAEVRHGDADVPKKAMREKLDGLAEEYAFKELIAEALFEEETLDKVLAQHPNDVDTVFNLAFALLDQLGPEEMTELVPGFVGALTRSNKVPQLNLKLLNTFFNVLDAGSEGRHVVLAAMLRYALDNGLHKALHGQFKSLDAWLDSWPVTQSERADLYFLAFNVTRLNGQAKEQQDLLLKYFRALEGADADTLAKARPYAARAAIAAVKSEGVSEGDALLGLAAVAQLQGDKEFAQTFELLRIVAREGVAEFQAFAAANADFMASTGLDGDEALAKMRTVTLCSIGAASDVLSFDDVAKALVLEGDTAVEEAVIAAVVSGHVAAKIDQARRVVLVQRTSMRTYQQEQWKGLKDKLDVWRDSVRTVLTSVMETRAQEKL